MKRQERFRWRSALYAMTRLARRIGTGLAVCAAATTLTACGAGMGAPLAGGLSPGVAGTATSTGNTTGPAGDAGRSAGNAVGAGSAAEHGASPSTAAAAGTGTGATGSGSASGAEKRTGSTDAAKTVAPPILRPGSRGPQVLALQQALAQLGYLPLQWNAQPGGGGSWQWRWPVRQVPAALMSQWQPSVYNVLTQGAVMAFQAASGLDTDGVAGPQTQAALAQALQHHRRNPWGYTFVSVSEALPETLTLWHDGNTVLTTRVNTGIPASPTTVGTFPVYLQYRSQTMSGVTPWDTHYSDPGVPYVSYFYRGEAVHGFVRRAYGYPQSLGCVEMPVQDAARAWPYIHIGTLVHISPAGQR